MQVHYDPSIIALEAGRLYQQAEKIVMIMVVRFMLAGVLLGLVGGGAAGAGFREVVPGAVVGAMAFALFGTILGYQYGQTRAFFLRLEAQRMLVLVQIEMNTRPR